jgi:hypothetical protein
MPPCPAQREQQRRAERGAASLKTGQREAAPAHLLAEAIEDEVGEPVDGARQLGELGAAADARPIDRFSVERCGEGGRDEEQRRRDQNGDEEPSATDQAAPAQASELGAVTDETRHRDRGRHRSEAAGEVELPRRDRPDPADLREHGRRPEGP